MHVIGLMLLAVSMPLAAGAAPIRTLVYAFTYDARGFSNGSSMSATGAVSDSFGNGHAARSGKITVSVIEATPDGGLVVDVDEVIDRRLHPLQTVRCALYGTTADVICDQHVGQTAEEDAVLTFLGRGFYDPAHLDAKQSWQTSPRLHESGEISITDTFTVQKSDADMVTLDIDKEEKYAGSYWKESGTVIYDPGHLDARSVRIIGNGPRSDLNVSADLVSDSMAPAAGGASPNPH
jgi:hypothetical protein